MAEDSRDYQAADAWKGLLAACSHIFAKEPVTASNELKRGFTAESYRVTQRDRATIKQQPRLFCKRFDIVDQVPHRIANEMEF